MARPGIVIADPEDIQAVADAFTRLLDDDGLRRRMGERSRAARRSRSSPTTCSPRRLGDTLGVYD